MATYEAKKAKQKVSPLEAELIKNILRLSPEQQRDLLIELNARKGSARRRYVRQPYSHAIQFAVEGKLFNGFVRDVSNGGAFVATLKSDLEQLQKGQNITMSFESPYEGDYVKRTGEIARIGHDGIGIAFDRVL